MTLRTLVLSLLLLGLMPACNDVLDIHPPADELQDAGAE